MRHLFLPIVGLAGSLLMKVWIGGLRRQIIFEHPSHNPLTDECSDNQVIAIWHENLLLAAYLLAKRKQYTIISQSKDGEYIARIVEKMGLRTIRGSSSRGAVTAVRKLLRASSTGQQTHIGITTDGPRGPRREMKGGAVFLAAKAGMVIMPIGIAFDRPWRAKSWDRFALPRPFSRVVAVGGTPIRIPQEISGDELENHRQRAQAELERVQELAERRVAGHDLPAEPGLRPAA